MGPRAAEAPSATIPAVDLQDVPAKRCAPAFDAAGYLATIVESSDDAIIGKGMDGTVFSWNAGAERLYGYHRDEMVGRSIALIIPPERAAELPEIMARLRRGERVEHFETVRMRKDGRRIEVSVSISPIHDGDGTVVGASAIARDISGRKAAQDAEREALARLRAVIETAVDGIITIDERGTIESVNPAAVRMFGYAADELIDQNISMLMPEPYRGAHDTYLSNYLRTGERKIIGIGREVHGRRKDGSVFPLELAVSETHLRGRRIFTGILRDGSARRAAEQALRESEERFRLMADCAPDLIWLGGTDGERTWFNARWLRFTGRAMEQELGDGWTECIHPEELERCRREYAGVFAARVPFEMEYRLRRSDGEYRWVREAGVPIQRGDGVFAGYIGSCIDLTDRRLGEETLRERVAQRTHELSVANEQLQYQIEERRRIESLLAAENRILELMATGADEEHLLTVLCETLESLIPHSFCAIRLASARVGTPAAPEPAGTILVGADVFGAIAGRGVYPPLCAEREVVARVAPEADGVLRGHGVRSCWFEPLVGAGGSLVGTLGVYGMEPGGPDKSALAAGAMATRLAAIIVERAQAAVRAREQLAQLAHVARLATMGEMASGLAHELNQPLCAIVNFTEACAELVSRNEQDANQLVRALREVARQAERAGEVIRRLRAFVKRGEPERQAVDINGVARDVAALTGAEVRDSDVRVRLKLATRLPPVYADAIQVEQVLVNLVRNACEAMREGASPSRVLVIETVRRRGEVEVKLSDSGPGISEEVRRRLFEPFFTTKRNGMGMGLSISRSILEAHEGRIWVTPQKPGGTTFHFTLPTVWRARRGRGNRIRRG